jgi:hypothetical protein
MRVDFIQVKDLDEYDMLPHNWNVAVYWHEQRAEYILEVIKKKGFDIGSSYMPKTYASYTFSEKQLGAIESVVYPTKQHAKVFSLGRFANFIDDYAPLKDLASSLRMYA